MSPNTPNDFIGSLVEMAEAYRELPKVQEALSDAQGEIGRLTNTVARLEAKLMDRSNEITAHLATIRSLEVERDDAQFQALEADDRTQRALDFIKATFGNAGTLIQALEPPAKPTTPDVPVPAVPEAAGEAQGVSVPSGEPVAPSMVEGSVSWQSTEHVPNVADATSPMPSPALEVAPMQASPTGAPMETGSSQSVPISSAEPKDTASSESPSAPFSAPPIDRGKYHGMTYSEARNHFSTSFTWPSKDEWLSDGGTLDNFYA